jgi:hypothetical protein
MKRAIGYINVVGCVGLLVICAVALVNGEIDADTGTILPFIAIVVTSVSGIYLFAARRNTELARLESIITQNAILQLKLEHDKLKQQAAADKVKSEK